MNALTTEAHPAIIPLESGQAAPRRGAVRDALDEYEAARAIEGDDATTYYNIGVASQDLGGLGGAIAAYEQAIELAPRFADARYNLAASYEELGNETLAFQHFREYKELLEGR